MQRLVPPTTPCLARTVENVIISKPAQEVPAARSPARHAADILPNHYEIAAKMKFASGPGPTGYFRGHRGQWGHRGQSPAFPLFHLSTISHFPISPSPDFTSCQKCRERHQFKAKPWVPTRFRDYERHWRRLCPLGQKTMSGSRRKFQWIETRKRNGLKGDGASD